MVSASFIGLGKMGSAMANNLLRNGVQLFVHNRSKDKATDLLQKGAIWLSTPKEAFDQAPIVFSMVANDQALQAITEGPDGILENAKPGCIHVSMSTVSPRLVKDLAAKHQEKGIQYVAAPVFGRPEAAAQQALTICLAGDTRAKQQVEPLLRFVSKKIHDFGEEPNIANSVKLAGNFMILSMVETLAEAYAFAEKSDVPMETLHSLITESLFPAPYVKTYGRIIMERHFSPAGFSMPLGLKDIDLLLQTADNLRVPLPIAGLLHDRLVVGLANNRENLDWSAIALTVLEEAGLNSTPAGIP